MKMLTTAIAAVLLTTGCATKEGTGTIVGGAVGAAAGATLARAAGVKGGGAAAAALVGAYVGANYGKSLGAYLDAEDAKQMALLERRALTTGARGTFVATKSKATVSVQTAEPTFEKPRDYNLPSTVKPQQLVLVDPITIRAYVDTPVYNLTDEASAPKLVIKQGVPIQVSAKVANSEWVVVGDDRVGLGYVPRRYLEASVVSEARPGTQQSETPAAPPPKAPPTAPGRKGKPASQPQPQPQLAKLPSPAPTNTAAKAPVPINTEQYEAEMAALRAANKPSAGSSGGPSSSKTPNGVTVARVSSECKVLTRKIVPPSGGGDPVSEDVKFCNEPPSGWQKVA